MTIAGFLDRLIAAVAPRLALRRRQAREQLARIAPSQARGGGSRWQTVPPRPAVDNRASRLGRRAPWIPRREDRHSDEWTAWGPDGSVPASGYKAHREAVENRRQNDVRY